MRVLLLLLLSQAAFGQMRNYNITIAGYKCAVFTPKVYDSTKPINTIIFMHGSGQTGGNAGDINKIYTDGLPKVLKAGLVVNALVIAPQNNWGGYDGRFPNILAGIESLYKIDKLSLCGLSAGGGNVWEQVTMVSQAFSGKFYAVESLSPSSVQTGNVAWVKGTTTKFLSRAGTQASDATYYGNAVTIHNAINNQAPGRSRLITNNTMGHGANFTTPYQDSTFWNFILPGASIPPPVVIPPAAPFTPAQIAIIDSIVTSKLVIMPAATGTNDGFMTKEVFNKIVSLENRVKELEAKLLAMKNVL